MFPAVYLENTADGKWHQGTEAAIQEPLIDFRQVCSADIRRFHNGLDDFA
jgi:hypothetical protein